MYTSVEIKKVGNKYQLFIDGKFIKENLKFIELVKEIEEFERHAK